MSFEGLRFRVWFRGLRNGGLGFRVCLSLPAGLGVQGSGLIMGPRNVGSNIGGALEAPFGTVSNPVPHKTIRIGGPEA